jgi:hypothetical protein
MTVQNTDAKVKDLQKEVAPQYYPWFANYMVVKRAAQVRQGGHAQQTGGLQPTTHAAVRLFHTHALTPAHYCRTSCQRPSNPLLTPRTLPRHPTPTPPHPHPTPPHPTPPHPTPPHPTPPHQPAQEPNFHLTYVDLVEKWNERKLTDLFIRTTVHYVKVMIASKLLKANSSERTLLKNLGSWLGKLTLAKNRAVLQVRGRGRRFLGAHGVGWLGGQ